MSKLINISDETYRKLKVMKGEEKSFTYVIETLLKKNTNTSAVIACAGKGGIDENKFSEIKKGWKKWTETSV